jgi:hypothetical protein
MKGGLLPIMKCRICDTRKPRRHCPGVSGDICSQCCGAEREVSIHCPLDCQYLVEARLHEKRVSINPEEVPNRDVPVTEQFLREQEALLVFLGAKLLDAALTTSGAVDHDLREALESLIRTYRTLESGLYYETRPDNMVAASVQQKITESIDTLRKELAEKGAPSIRDSEILGVLVFVQRIALIHDNGRPRGRAFVDYLRAHFPQERAASPAPSLIQV